jgi:hypothetical protein
VLLYYTFTDNLKSSVAGCAVILAGIPVFYLFKHSLFKQRPSTARK